MAKNEIISAWNQVAQKLMVDMMDNTVPPFTIAAGTRITVYSPSDLMVTCGDPKDSDKKCAIAPYGSAKRFTHAHDAQPNYEDGTWVGQARSFNLAEYCTSADSNGKRTAKEECKDPGACGGYDYRTVLMYCESLTYTTKSKVKQEAYHESEVKKYHPQTPSPIFPKVLTGRLAASCINEKKMIGITIILSIFTSTEPNGERIVNALPINSLP
jgi:hypothetical protein